MQECINRTRQRVWKKQPEGFLAEAYLDVDGTVAGTYGECKGGMAMSYKGIWGYAPLLVSLANTKEVLYTINRPGNAPSHPDSVPWIDRAIELVKPVAGRITLRGDTDFSHTAQLDRWDEAGTCFILGLDAHPTVVTLAECLSEQSWRPLERLPKHEILTEPRRRPERVKEAIVVEKGYLNEKLVAESVNDMTYQPALCQRKHRLVILRKNISVQKGANLSHLVNEIRYFFYLTNRWDLTVEEIVGLANQRCDQENVIEQLKNGVNAMRMPVDDLVSNGAYMVMAALAWNLKAWFALLVPERERGLELLKMEFRGFLQAVLLLPVQIIRAGRRIVWRILSYNRWLSHLFATFERIMAMEPG